MDTHPDLVALAEGRLEGSEREMALKHLASCPACEADYQSIKEAVMQLDNIAQITQRACAGSPELYEMLDERLGTPSEARMEGEQADYLIIEDTLENLPPKLAGALAAKRPQAAAQDGLMRAIKNIAGKSGQAAQALADKIMGGAGLEAGAPAMREDSTKEDEAENPDEDQEIKDKE
jgi:anti-sigma factor RsiW